MSEKHVYPHDFSSYNYGLTKREYYAVRAMNGLLSREAMAPTVVVKKAVEYADALIKELGDG